VVAAVQALERSVAAHASRLFSLEHRAGNSEKKHLDCEKMVGEFGNQLESKCAALGTLIQEYGRLQRRLENMENLLKNRNLWILRLPPGVEAPAAALENDATGFPTQEWENLEEWQRELYGKVLTGKREALVLLDDVISEPALLSRLQGGEAPCGEEPAPQEIPASPDCSIPEASFAVTVKQEEEEEPYAKEQGAMEGVEFPELGVEDSIIQIKQEKELCSAGPKEEEAAEAPGEPCPERGFYEPEASGEARKGSEVGARELPGTEDEEL
ncbi:ZN783 protein, partial [Dryoscopus gambensis]|nr:ZN783 protein [Dryoscopus gambensis]